MIEKYKNYLLKKKQLKNEVFNYMFDEDLDDILKKISTQTLVLRIPVKLKGDNDDEQTGINKR